MAILPVSLSFMLMALCFLASLVSAQVPFSSSKFQGAFASSSGVLQSLKPSSNTGFDFSPSDYYSNRNGSGQYHTGDLTFRWRLAGSSGNWTNGDTAANRSVITPVSNSSASGPWVSSLKGALAGSSGVLNVTRTWAIKDGDMTLSFTIQNIAKSSVELGSVGMPIEFNNIFVNRTPADVTAKCVLIDPYVGLHAGYLQVTRIAGTGPNLVVTPFTNDTKLEAWRFLQEPQGKLGYQLQTYEGNYEWQVYSKAYAEQEWKGVQPWNQPTSKVLASGSSVTVGLRFSLAQQVSDIESVVSSLSIPVAVGLPGYVLPQGLVGKLFINSTMSIPTIDISPPGALNWTRDFTFAGSWQGFDIKAASFGRARMTFTFADGRSLAVHYWLAGSSPTALGGVGNFATTKQWYTDTSDPFQRAPSVISYDHDAMNYVLQDNRSWIAGLENEGGAGAWVAAAMKQAYWPDATEVNKLEQYLNETVWGFLQSNGSSNWPVYNFPGNSSQAKYGIRDSLFYYQPGFYNYSNYFNWQGQPGISGGYGVNRAYDYVWVSSLYWALYKVGRTNPGLTSRPDPTWYLKQAFQTVNFTQGVINGQEVCVHYFDGLMGETVWGEILADLRAENLTTQANTLETAMRARQKNWASEAEPYGSELAWDSTGEEGVYYWSTYFNDTSTAGKTIDRIRGYMPTVAHWGWNGNARRYWDFLYAGMPQLSRIERQIHHYGSGLNALPMLANYRRSSDPQSLQAMYDLRVGYGGNQGPLSNIGSDGFGSMAFHSFPDTLRWDAYSGDYGPNFLGHVLGAATYLVQHPIFYWQSLGGNILSGGSLRDTDSTPIVVQPVDAVRKRIFVAPLSLWVRFDAGTIRNFTYTATTNAVTVSIGPACLNNTAMTGCTPAKQAVMKWEQLGGGSGGGKGKKVRLDQHLAVQRGGYVVPLTSGGTNISFSVV